jgi:hypothetical protein
MYLKMDAIAKKQKQGKHVLFKPLIMAREILTSNPAGDKYEEWVDEMKSLVDELHGEKGEIIYRVMAVLLYKYKYEIDKHKHKLEDIIEDIGVDRTEFYSHYYSDDMREDANKAKTIEFHGMRNDMLMSLAENATDDALKYKALVEIGKSIKVEAPKKVVVNSKNAAVDLSTNKEVGMAFDIDELSGQGDPDFRRRIKGNGSTELEEIETIEGETSEFTD